MMLLLHGEPVQIVRMVIPFVFRFKKYPAGSWLLFTTPRQALTQKQYLAMFPQPEIPEW